MKNKHGKGVNWTFELKNVAEVTQKSCEERRKSGSFQVWPFSQPYSCKEQSNTFTSNPDST